MTPLRRPLRRAVRDLVVALYPNGVVGIRERRHRFEVTIPVTHLYSQLVKAHVAQRKGTTR